MDSLTGKGLNFLLHENEQKHENVSKHIPVPMPGSTYEASFLSDNLLTSSPKFFTSALNESSSVCISNCRAIFSVHLPSSQILDVNSAACQLMNYTSNELCSMKLENLILESHRHKLSKLYENFLKNNDSEIFHANGKLIEFIKKDGDNILVSVFLKKIDNPERYLAIAEPLDRRTGLITMNQCGKIISFDEEIPLIFKYDATELIDTNIHTLLPSIILFQEHENPDNEFSKQHLTGRTKFGEVFPLFSIITKEDSSLTIFKVSLHVYTCISGLVLLNKKLLITNFNSNFIKLLFGYSKKMIVNKPVTLLIPAFCKDTFYEKRKKVMHQNGSPNTSPGSLHWKNEFQESKNTSTTDCSSTNLKSAATQSFQDSTDSRQSELSNTELNPQNDYSLDAIYQRNENQKECDFFYSETQPKCDCKMNCSFDSEFVKGIETCACNEDKSLLNQYDLVQEGKFLGLGRHCDGSFIEIKYQVQISAIRGKNYYCLWLSRNLKKNFDMKESNRGSPVSCQFISPYIDYVLAKDSINSEHFTRPSTASSISQCDDFLTAGDYSKHYTNIKQIGKGTFGYVKMAFRDSDGLLVVTKFIKKQKISLKSWVFNSSLNMKIPLEISFLITLQHPNIVKVLDVFHNDSFVQLVMEKHGAGLDLFEFINRRPKCDEKLKSFIFRQIISAVYYLDSLGILHRDIKDENVIINEKFEIKLIDFGSATFMPPGETFSKFYGTVGYYSPEVLQGNAYKGPELEIWALGVTLYVLTFGENPFYDIENTIKAQFCIPFPISKDLNDLLHKMLDKNVETRITIDKVIADAWINQPVAIENYQFEDVVKCSFEEAFPSKYVYEINVKEFESRTTSCSDQVEDSNYLNNSFQNLSFDTLDDLDDDFPEPQEASKSVTVERRGSVMFSSTPVHKKTERLCKSASGLHKQMENSLTLSSCCYEYHSSDSLSSEDLGGKNVEAGHINGFVPCVKVLDEDDVVPSVIDKAGDLDIKVNMENNSLNDSLKKMSFLENKDYTI